MRKATVAAPRAGVKRLLVAVRPRLDGPGSAHWTYRLSRNRAGEEAGDGTLDRRRVVVEIVGCPPAWAHVAAVAAGCPEARNSGQRDGG
jgi:hypothetical protein